MSSWEDYNQRITEHQPTKDIGKELQDMVVIKTRAEAIANLAKETGKTPAQILADLNIPQKDKNQLKQYIRGYQEPHAPQMVEQGLRNAISRLSGDPLSPEQVDKIVKNAYPSHKHRGCDDQER